LHNSIRHIFEKRAIEKYIEENGRCPITGQELTKEDLKEINGRCRVIYSRESYSAKNINRDFNS
jgi:hypothetical protein